MNIASAEIALDVRAPGDRDGDGIPDDYEVLHHLNPDDPNDAAMDPDQDGLTNLQEYQLGTDPEQADTDGDGVPDGLEVAQGTNPLVPDAPPPPPPTPVALDASCVVSAFNRSAPVQPDGSWVLPNVPANLGPVRVRATCVENGISRSGQSPFITVPVNDVIKVAEIDFDHLQSVPAVLALTAAPTQLTAAGQTVQLAAVATYPGGATADVTADTAGTSYRSSNPAVASVDANGLVTARASGAVLVSATNEGTLAIVQLQVLLSADSDGDGLPDDYEIAHGLDPNNPADALDDPDHDGLTTLQEFQLGTDPLKSDTDGDGLSDGDEVNLYHTNPLLADTDGDGVSDGLEIRAGSNPLDPNSVSLAGILSGITVTPQSFTLVFNTVFGEASRRLTVRGQLIDGTSLDIAAPRYGTTYLSSSLATVNFGAEPGRLFAGQSGPATVTVRNNGFTAAVQVTVQTFSPTALAFLPLPGATNGVAAEGNYAYVAGGSAGLNVVDVTNLQHPALVATRTLPGTANDLAADGGFVYVAAGDAGLQVVDVRTPAAPVVVGVGKTAGPALDVVVKGGRAYVADSVGLRIFDLTNPAAPALLGGVSMGGRARGVDVGDGYAVVAAESAGVFVVDVSDPTQPHVVGSTGTRYFGGSNAAAVVVRGREAYVADGAQTLGGLKVVNFGVPSTPVVVGATGDSFGLSDVASDGRFVLAADYYFVNTVPIFDVSLLPPVFNARLDFNGPPAFRDDNGQGIALRDGVVFLAADRCNLFRFGTVGCGGLYVGRYLLGEQDGSQTEPPTVALTSPTAGAQVHERNTLQVTASASGEVRVTSVQFLVNGQPAFTDYAAPYTYSFSVPAGPGSMTLGAVATDIAGHQTTAAPVTVQVVPDDKPTVALLAPTAGSRFTEGVTIPLAATASDDVRVAAVEFFVDGASQGVRIAAPYQVSYTIPLGKTQLTIRAVATDSAGQTATTSDVVVGVDRDPPPVVTVLDPPAGATVVEGSQITVSVGATDNTAITRVQLSIGGQTPLQKTSPPYTFTVDVPLGAGQLSFTASATDTVGQVATATSTLMVTADPLTTAVGRVIDPDGNPVAGANVASGAVTGTTLADGTFSLPGLPTTRSIVVSASATLGGKPFSGRSLAVPPAPGGTTYVGDIALRTRAVVGYYDLSLNGGNSNQLKPIQVAGFDAVNVGNLATADLSAIDIFFVQNPNNSFYSAVYIANLPKIFAFIQNGGILVFNDREVTDAASILPGSPGQIVRDFSDGANINILDNTTKVTNGPGGILTNSSLDGGNFSSHGFAVSSTLPADARRIFSQTDPQRVVLFSYGYGRGKVIYATIPLDFYLGGTSQISINMGIYAANLLAYANDLR